MQPTASAPCPRALPHPSPAVPATYGQHGRAPHLASYFCYYVCFAAEDACGLPDAPASPLPACLPAVYNDNVSNMEFTLDTPKGPLTRAFGLPGGHWRNIVIALAWTAFAVCALCVPLSFKAGK